MVVADVFYNKIVNDEDKEDRAPFLAPNFRGGGGLVLPRCVEVSFEELVGNNTSLG